MPDTIIRLEKDPIVEAVCELRFDGPSGKGPLLLGALYNQFKSEFPTHESLPAAQLPPQIREVDSSLRYTAVNRLVGQGRMISVGDHVVSIAVQAPYPGWSDFRDLISRIFRACLQSELIGEVSRFSVKYVNLLEVPADTSIPDVLKVSVQLGDDDVENGVIHIRRDVRRDGAVCVVQVLNPVTVLNRAGIVVDVDVIREPVPADFRENLEVALDETHDLEKRIFFGLLTSETVTSYGPIYG